MRYLLKRRSCCAHACALAGVVAGAGAARAQSTLVFADTRVTPITDAATVQNTIHVGSGPLIAGVRVVVKVLHSRAGDLDLVLVRNGAYVKLSSGNGGSSDYFTTRFRDDAPDSICEGSAPFNGDFRPEGGVFNPDPFASIGLPWMALTGLSAFNGQSADGDWSLWIDDAENNGVGGTLVYWSLEFNAGRDINGPYGLNAPPPPPPTYVESGESGALPVSAQAAAGSGPLARIAGWLAPGDADMYAVRVCDPANFSVTSVGGTDLDTQLYLFDAGGRGVACNDDEGAGPSSQSTIGADNLSGGGTYYIAVTAYERLPVDAQGWLIWDRAVSDLAERTPDGPGAGNPVQGWTDGAAGAGGAYRLMLTGACFVGSRCGSTDFNCDGDEGTDADIEAFFACVAGNCPGSPCASNADFDGDGDSGTDADIETFFRVLAGGPC
jgi:subtilisin-like proprotein convertase family protein